MKYDDIIISYGLLHSKYDKDLPTVVIAGVKDEVTTVLKVLQGGDGVIKLSDLERSVKND